MRLFLLSDAVMTRRISPRAGLDPEQRAEGETWYAPAWAICEDLAIEHQASPRVVADLVAALRTSSCLTVWRSSPATPHLVALAEYGIAAAMDALA